MHIAICDDNVADRKHLERLLSRESDKRAGTPNILYIDSYGKKENFLHNCHKYDLIFLDMVSTPTIAEEIVLELQRMEITAPIVMYSSKIDYTQNPKLPDSIVHMSKPYVPYPLPELLALGDAYIRGKIVTVPVTIEQLQHDIPIDEIHYIYATQDVCHMVLKDGSERIVEETILELSVLLEPFKEFYRLKKEVIINVKYITLLTYIFVSMQDYQEFYFAPWKYSELKQLRETINSLS